MDELRQRGDRLLARQGYTDVRWLSGQDMAVCQWVRMKCRFGCPSYGKKGACPPAVPSVAECRELFREYDHIAIIRLRTRFNGPEEREEWSRRTNRALLGMERAFFLAGYPKAFLLFMDECRLCQECGGTREGCLNPREARPSPEALAVDVFSTVRKAGFPLEVLTRTDQTVSCYAFLLVQ